MYNYSKLIGRIIEFFGNQRNFSKAIEMSEHTVSLKLNNKLAWKQPEIQKTIEVLKLSESDIPDYFFTKLVQ